MTQNEIYCRTCLCVLQQNSSRCPKVYNIFDTVNFSKKLKQCSTISVEPYDQYPHSVCGKCYEKVMDFYEFQLMCRNSLRMLNEMYDCDNDLEEALGDENYFSNAECFEGKHYQNGAQQNDEQILETDFQEDHLIDIIAQHEYENGDFGENIICKQFVNITEVEVIKMGQLSLTAPENDAEGILHNSVESHNCGNEALIQTHICSQQEGTCEENVTENVSLIIPSVGNCRMVNQFNGNAENRQLHHDIDQFIVEESVTNYEEIEPKESTAITRRNQAEEDHIETTLNPKKGYRIVGNCRMVNQFNGNAENRQLHHDIDQFIVEESVTNYEELEPKESTAITRRYQAEEDHIDPTLNPKKECEFVMDDADTVLPETDAYETKENRVDSDKDLLEHLIQNASTPVENIKNIRSGQKKYAKVNVNPDANVQIQTSELVWSKRLGLRSQTQQERAHKDVAITKRQTEVQPKETHKVEDGTLSSLSKNEKIPSEIPLNKKENKKKSKPIKNRRYSCNICNKYFRFNHMLDAHKRRHEGLQGYPCTRENCERTFNRFRDFDDHLKDHDGIPRTIFECKNDNCDREFLRMSSLNMHLRKVHKILPAKQTHECATCGKIFKHMQKLREHSFIHKDKSTWLYTCDVEGCMQKCRTWIHMRIHKNRHAGIKKFTCPHCGIAKTTSQELRSHINFHTSERTWSCEHCTKVCKTLANLQRHTKNKHSGSKREFKCSFCHATFATIEVKKSHEKRHTSDKPHVCEDCGMRFIWPYNLREHKTIHMKITKENKPTKKDSYSKIRKRTGN